MINPVDVVLKKCMRVRKDESVLIVTDSELYRIGRIFFQRARRITSKVKVMKIKIPKVHGTNPSESVSNEMLKHDVQLLITTKSLTHTTARKEASARGARIVTMPGITFGTLNRAINIDYRELKKIHAKLADIIDKGKKVKIETALGTNLVFSIEGRRAFGREVEISKKGEFGNLPTGEIFVAPVEETANGIFIVDASFAGIGKLKNLIKVFVKDGYATSLSGQKAKKLKRIVDNLGKESRNIAEFGIGTNKKAKIIGNILEDEKVMGTCHIALGNNAGFGGKVDVPLHLDGIIKKPTIWIDRKKIMDKGKML